MRSFARGVVVAMLAGGLAASVAAQRRAMDLPLSTDASHRTRLILKDGSYQVVLMYKVDGGIVRYRSAERGGEVEEIPLKLVDLAATEKWAKEHASVGATEAARATPVLSPELAKEEAERAARTPEVATNLRLPDEDSLLVLDTFKGTPELVPLNQTGGDLNKQTAHNVLKAMVNPLSSAHQILEIQGEKADVQLHVPDPVLYVRVGEDDPGSAAGGAMTVDTHGAAGRAVPSGGAATSKYVIVRVDVRRGSRVVESFRINMLGGVKRQADVVETKAEALPGGHWMKLTPVEPLEFGEYAVMEVMSEKEVNLGVWDFGVHPTAVENADAILPQEKKKVGLERRKE